MEAIGLFASLSFLLRSLPWLRGTRMTLIGRMRADQERKKPAE
jgi:hypothetical protein